MAQPHLRILPEPATKTWLGHEWHREIANFVLPPKELLPVPGAIATPALQLIPEEAQGGIYDAKGRHLAISRHLRRGRDFTATTPLETPLPSDAPILRGRHLYLGWFFDHYGHFILESLGRCWALAEAGPVDGYLFHRPENSREASSQLLSLLELLGIPRHRVRFIEETARVEELLVPSQQAVLARGMSRETLELYNRMAFRAWKRRGQDQHHDSLYISRRFLASDMRQAANEWMLERWFRARGYRVLHPQYLDSVDQLSLYFKARRFAGLDGSGLHNVLFAEAPQEVWMLGAENRLADAITQAHLNQLKKCHTTLLLQSVTRTEPLPPQRTPFLIQPSSHLSTSEISPLDRFNWLSQLATRLSRAGCKDAESAALEPRPDKDEFLVLQALLDHQAPAPEGTAGDELLSFLSVHRQLTSGKTEEAAGKLQRLLPAYRQHPEFLILYAKALEKRGDYEEALKVVADALPLDPDNPRLRLLQAGLLLGEKGGAAALEPLQGVIDRWPRFFPARIKLAESLARLERFDDAARQLRTVLEQKPSARGLWNRLSWYLYRAGRLQEAKEAALESLELAPENAIAPAHLARIHLQLGEPEQALAWLDRALERAPARAELQRLRKRILSVRE